MPTAVLLLLTVLVWPETHPGRDEAPDEGGPVVTEEAFLAALGPEHAAWQALEGNLAEAEAEVRRAGTLPNPRLEFGREAPEGLPAQNTWLLAWTPPLDGRRGPTRAAAAAGLRAARAGLAADRLTLRSELRRMFAAWAIAFERVALVATHAQRVDRAAETLRHRAVAGEVSGLAARRLGLASEEARAALARAGADLARARAEILGVWPDLPSGARPELPPLPEPPGEPDVSARPDLVALDEQADEARFEARAAGRYWGFPELVFGWQTLHDTGVSLDGPVFAVSWSLPLFDRDQGRRAEAEGRARVLAARHALARSRAAAELEGARAAYVGLRDAARRASESARQSGEVVHAARAAFEAGETDVTDLNDTFRAALTAELEALGLRGETLAAVRALEMALGQPLGTGGAR